MNLGSNVCARNSFERREAPLIGSFVHSLMCVASAIIFACLSVLTVQHNMKNSMCTQQLVVG